MHFVSYLQCLQHCKNDITAIVLITKTVTMVHSHNTSNHESQTIVRYTSF